MDLRRINVLVVDDLPINRLIVRKYLQPLGAKIIEAESAKQALALLEEAAVKRGGGVCPGSGGRPYPRDGRS